MRRRQPAVVAALSLCAHWFQTEPAQAQQPAADAAAVARAEAHASAAFEAYRRKEYVRAVSLYEQALSAAPNAALVLYNIARIYDVGLRSRGLAIDYYHRFIAAPGAAPEQISNARTRIAELEAAERAAVHQKLALEAAPQREAAPRDAVVPAAPRLARPSLPPPAEPAWTSREVAAVAVGGVGLASVGVGAGYWLSARAKSDIWKRDCDGNACSTERAVNAAEAASTQFAVGAAALVAGGALMALGGVLWFVDFSSGTPAEGPSSWSLSPVVGRSEISAAFSGRF